jgi:hypothetical protein
VQHDGSPCSVFGRKQKARRGILPTNTRGGSFRQTGTAPLPISGCPSVPSIAVRYSVVLMTVTFSSVMRAIFSTSRQSPGWRCSCSCAAAASGDRQGGFGGVFLMV